MALSRELTNRIRWFLDETLPPIVRDSALFNVLLRIVARTQYPLFRDFRDDVSAMSEREFAGVYETVQAIERETDLSRASLEAILNASVGPKVLDAGAGRGFLAGRLLKAGFDVTAVDVAPQPMPDARIAFHQASVETLPFEDAAFDTVISTHTLEHVRDLPAAISELRRVARKRLIVVVPRQRPYRVSFDLHLSFFPYEWNLRAALGARGTVEVRDIEGDWFYTETY
jgi:SAM-dependent methyltransferase